MVLMTYICETRWKMLTSEAFREMRLGLLGGCHLRLNAALRVKSKALLPAHSRPCPYLLRERERLLIIFYGAVCLEECVLLRRKVSASSTFTHRGQNISTGADLSGTAYAMAI